MASITLAPYIAATPSGFYSLRYSIGGRSKVASLRTKDPDEAARLVLAKLAQLECLFPEDAARWKAVGADWSKWIQRQAKHLAKSTGYDKTPPARIREELEARLKAQGYRCAVSGVPLMPLVHIADSAAWLAVLIRKDPLEPWAPSTWRIVAQICAASLVFGADEFNRLCLQTVINQRLNRKAY